MLCNKGDKPVVKYKFGEGGWRTFKSEVSPIQITQKSVPIPSTDGYNHEGFVITTNIYNYSQPTISVVVRDYRVDEILPHQPFYGGSNRYVSLQLCEDEALPKVAAYAFDMSTFVVSHETKCADAKKQRCSIQVFGESGLIFQDQGDCPCVSEVQCGNCPDEHIECKASHYPGYCCVPCASTSNAIHNLANRIN